MTAYQAGWNDGREFGRREMDQNPARNCPYYAKCSAHPVTNCCKACPVDGPRWEREGAEAALARLRELRDDWASLPAWGPDERGLMILDLVDRDGLLAEFDEALSGTPNPRHRRPGRAARRAQVKAALDEQPCGPCREGDHHACRAGCPCGCLEEAES